jgi:hypothetical protein
MTTNHSTALADLSDQEILARTHDAVRCERVATARLVALLTEVDARRLYLGEGCSSLFTYCTQVLHLSEHTAYGRIEAARAARRFPVMLDLLADGSITLTTVCLLGPVLTPENHAAVLAAARHQGKRTVEQMVATLRPQLDVPSVIRKLPAPSRNARPLARVAGSAVEEPVRPTEQPTCAAPTAPTSAARRPVVVPLAPERYKLQITIGRSAHDALRRAQDLLRHQVPDGDPAAIVGRALMQLVTELERKKMSVSARSRAKGGAATSCSRYVPAVVRRTVWARDQGRCAFVGALGRCRETGFLQLHHRIPYAVGGATTATNLELRCRAHNQYEAERYFRNARSAASKASPPPIGVDR